MILGHAHPAVIEALQTAAAKGASQGTSSSPPTQVVGDARRSGSRRPPPPFFHEMLAHRFLPAVRERGLVRLRQPRRQALARVAEALPHAVRTAAAVCATDSEIPVTSKDMT